MQFWPVKTRFGAAALFFCTPEIKFSLLHSRNRSRNRIFAAAIASIARRSLVGSSDSKKTQCCYCCRHASPPSYWSRRSISTEERAYWSRRPISTAFLLPVCDSHSHPHLLLEQEINFYRSAYWSRRSISTKCFKAPFLAPQIGN